MGLSGIRTFGSGGGGGSGSGNPNSYPNFASLPVTSAEGTLATTADNGNLYEWHNGAWELISGPDTPVAVQDTNSIDMSISVSNIISSDFRIGITSAPALTQGISLVIYGGSSPGVQGFFPTGQLLEVTSSVLQITGSGVLAGSSLGIQVNQATGSTSGYLSAADWARFNSHLGISTQLYTEFPLMGGTYIAPGITLSIAPASGSTAGYVTTATQTFGGDKTFLGTVLGADGTTLLPEFAFSADPNTGAYRPAADTYGIAAGGTGMLALSASGATLLVPIRGPDGTTLLPAYSFFNAPDMGMFRQSANQIGFAIGGTQFLSIGQTYIGATFARVAHADGSAANPSITFASEIETGFWRPGAQSIGVQIGGAANLTWAFEVTSNSSFRGYPVRWYRNGNDFFVGIKPSASLAASYEMTWPLAQGPTFGFLMNNGAGGLSFSLATIGVSTIASTPNANAMSFTDGALRLQPADASFGGVVTTSSQTFAGEKSFDSIRIKQSGSGATYMTMIGTSNITSPYTWILPGTQGSTFSTWINDGLGNWSYNNNDWGNIVTITNADHTAVTQNNIILFSTGNTNRTCNLYTAVGNSGKRLRIKKIDSGTGIVTIDPNSTETMDGNLTLSLSAQYQEITIVSDGTNWIVENLYASVANLDTDWQSYTPTFTGLGTVSGVSFYWRRQGPNLQIKGHVTCGTTTATACTVTIPSGLAIDSTGLSSNIEKTYGYFVKGTSATAYISNADGVGGVAVNNANTTTSFMLQSRVSGNEIQNDNASTIFSSGEKIMISGVLTIPISGWTTYVSTSAANMVFSSSNSGLFTNSTTTDAVVTGLTASIVSTGRPVMFGLMSASGSTNSCVRIRRGSGNTAEGILTFMRGASTVVGLYAYQVSDSGLTDVFENIPSSAFNGVDETVTAGTHTYTVFARIGAAGSGVDVDVAKLYLRET